MTTERSAYMEASEREIDRLPRLMAERDELRAEVEQADKEIARLRAWAEDEQQKRHAAEDARVEARSSLAYQEQENERLRAHVEGAEAVLELGKAWWLARGHSRAVAEAAFSEAVGSYDPAAWSR